MTLSDVQSGAFLDIKMVILDKYEQIVASENGMKLPLEVLGEKRRLENSNVITGITNYFSENGIFNISAAKLTLQPSSNTKIQFVTILGTQTLNIEFRPCLTGESYTELGECIECSSGSYLLYAPSEPTECTECLTLKTTCYGGNNIGPKPGYWRKSNETDLFLKCPLT